MKIEIKEVLCTDLSIAAQGDGFQWLTLVRSSAAITQLELTGTGGVLGGRGGVSRQRHGNQFANQLDGRVRCIVDD